MWRTMERKAAAARMRAGGGGGGALRARRSRRAYVAEFATGCRRGREKGPSARRSRRHEPHHGRGGRPYLGRRQRRSPRHVASPSHGRRRRTRSTPCKWRALVAWRRDWRAKRRRCGSSGRFAVQRRRVARDRRRARADDAGGPGGGRPKAAREEPRRRDHASRPWWRSARRRGAQRLLQAASTPPEENMQRREAAADRARRRRRRRRAWWRRRWRRVAASGGGRGRGLGQRVRSLKRALVGAGSSTTAQLADTSHNGSPRAQKAPAPRDDAPPRERTLFIRVRPQAS